jgi:hypothetical protein
MNLKTENFRVNEHQLSQDITDLVEAMGKADNYLDCTSGEELLMGHLNKESRMLMEVRDNLQYEGQKFLSRIQMEEDDIDEETIDFLIEGKYLEPEYNPLEILYREIKAYDSIIDWIAALEYETIKHRINLADTWLSSWMDIDNNQTDREASEAQQFLIQLTNLSQNQTIKPIMNYYNTEIKSNHNGK